MLTISSVNCRKLFLLIITSLIFFAAHATQNKSAFYRNYWHPLYHGKRLNYCSLDGKCGIAVASAYCRIMGYEGASQEIIANNVHTPPLATYYRLRRYVYPRFNHYRVDWCYDGQKGCGRKAAFSFCRRMGYTDVRQYRMQTQVGAAEALGNQKLCFGNACKGFANIDCYR